MNHLRTPANSQNARETEKTIIKQSQICEQNNGSVVDSTKLLISFEDIIIYPHEEVIEGVLLLSLLLEFETEPQAVAAEAKSDEILNAIITAFGNKTIDEFGDFLNRDKFREAIRVEVNNVLNEPCVHKVYFSSFSVQRYHKRFKKK